MTATWLDLAAAVGVAPSLPGARCRGRPWLFDPAGSREPAEVASQRHAQAISLCNGCPALGACRQWCTGLPRTKRPLGVVAGKVRGEPRVGRSA